MPLPMPSGFHAIKIRRSTSAYWPGVFEQENGPTEPLQRLVTLLCDICRIQWPTSESPLSLPAAPALRDKANNVMFEGKPVWVAVVDGDLSYFCDWLGALHINMSAVDADRKASKRRKLLHDNASPQPEQRGGPDAIALRRYAFIVAESPSKLLSCHKPDFLPEDALEVPFLDMIEYVYPDSYKTNKAQGKRSSAGNKAQRDGSEQHDPLFALHARRRQAVEAEIHLPCQVVSSKTGIDGIVRAFGLPTRMRQVRDKTQKAISQGFWKHCTITSDKDKQGLFLVNCTAYCRAGIAWRMEIPSRENYDVVEHLVKEFALGEKVEFKAKSLPRSLRLEEKLNRLSVHRWWTPDAFYDCVHVPEASANPDPAIRPWQMQTILYPFQQRAVAWLLQREGFELDSKEDNAAPKEDDLCPSFREGRDANGNTILASGLLNSIMTSEQREDWRSKPLRGGILAEEMGLGKTVELIALICLHKRSSGIGISMTDTFSGKKAIGVGGTLIITPPSILEQWKKELKVHAPSLKVYHYKGIRNESNAVSLKEYDVVLTTYQVLSTEIHYAAPQSDRELRRYKAHAPRRSVLVQVSWWRVCLDEAQMIEGGISNAAVVARQIPRRNSWAVSGTPFKRNANDLQGLLLFLRYSPFCDGDVWNYMLQHDKATFQQIFGSIAMRHTKASVRTELRLPQQSRVVIKVPFAAIEEQHYSQLFQQMCDDCGLDGDGGPTRQDWDGNDPGTVDKMRAWLNRLRQTCLHPEIGERNRKALGRGNGPLRALDEVLDGMIEQNEAQLKIEERAVLVAKSKQAHLYSFGQQPKKSLEIYLECLELVDVMVRECRADIEKERAKIRAEAQRSSEEDDQSDEASEDERDAEEKSSKLNSLTQRLRLSLEIQHTCTFFLANSYFQIKTDSSLTTEDSAEFHELDKKETEAYDAAKRIRGELLTEVSKKTLFLMDKVKASKAKAFVAVPVVAHFENARGIESRNITPQVEKLRGLLNEQAEQLQIWRQELTEGLLTSLLDQDDTELTGEEYEQTTIRQDEQYAYLDVLRALVADRITMITGQPNLLVNYEMKEAMRLAKDGNGPSPELMMACLSVRSQMMPQDGLSIRGIIADLRHLITSVRWQAGTDEKGRGAAESLILERELEHLQVIQSEQSKVAAQLEKELTLFRSTMNARLDFYRQIQQISDAVAPLQEEAMEQVDTAALKREEVNEEKHKEKLATCRTKRRFLQHLQADSTGDVERVCTICQDAFEVGVLTVCGHQYCRECIGLWYNQHKSCPICKRHLTTRDFHEVMYKPREIVADVESQSPNGKRDSVSGSGPTSPSRSRADSTSKESEHGEVSLYTHIKSSTLHAIQSIPLAGSFGTKIDTMARHLIYLRESDPGAKSIIFSQYRDFLGVLGTAFARFGIGYADIAAKDGITKFREDPSAECFLLHAKADSSGLNLVNATHVFLCEPLINAALELQAIARVHRIGQRRATTVWMYLVQDTVEESIYEITVRRRLEHLKSTRRRSSLGTPKGKGKHRQEEAVREEDIESANSGLLQDVPNVAKLMAKGSSGGEIVGKEDLWQCLFGTVGSRRHGWSADGAAVDVLNGKGQESTALSREVGRHLRAKAAEDRA